VFLVLGRIDEGNRSLPGFLLQQLDGLLLVLQFLPVALLELMPTRWVVAVPFPQLWAWGYVFQPQINGGALLGQAARPQPFHQDPKAIIFRGFFVSSLEFNHWRIPFVGSQGSGNSSERCLASFIIDTVRDPRSSFCGRVAAIPAISNLSAIILCGGKTSVGLYTEIIFPVLCDFGLNRPCLAEHRRKLLTHACGKVLEIGFGTGLNLECYPAHIRKIAAVDPNKGMYRRAQKRIERSGIEVDKCLLEGDRLPFEDRSFDCAISTFTLCSIRNVALALEEIFRVLTGGGRFLFLEHGLSPDPLVQKWQHRLNGLQKFLAGGCHLDRDIRVLVSALPFASAEIDEYYMEETPRTHGYMYQGIATK